MFTKQFILKYEELHQAGLKAIPVCHWVLWVTSCNSKNYRARTFLLYLLPLKSDLRICSFNTNSNSKLKYHFQIWVSCAFLLFNEKCDGFFDILVQTSLLPLLYLLYLLRIIFIEERKCHYMKLLIGNGIHQAYMGSKPLHSHHTVSFSFILYHSSVN